MTRPLIVSIPPRPEALRLPDPSGPDHEVSLAAANDRARGDSLSIMAEALPDFDLGAAAQTTDAGTFAVGTVGPSLSDELDGFDIVDRVLGEADLEYPRIRMLRDTTEIDTGALLERVEAPGTGRTRARIGPAVAYLDGGVTMVLDAVDRKHAALQRLAEHVERTFGCGINMNGYLSLRRQQSFGAHWDPHEVITLQLIGIKHWEVHAPPALSAHKAVHGEATTGQAVWSGVIGPGTSLQIPRGWGHSVTGIDDLSFHITFTIPRMAGLMVLERALGEDASTARPPTFPAVTGPPAEVGVAGVGDVLARAGSAGSVARQLSIDRTEIPARPVGSLAATIAALAAERRHGILVRAPLPGGVHVATGRDGAPVLAAARRTVAVDPNVVTWLAPLLDGRIHDLGTVDGYPAAPDAASVRSATDDLLHLGFLEPVSQGWGLTESAARA